MASQFIDLSAPSLRGGPNRRPEELPHGILTPPLEVQELVEKERPKYRPEAYARAREGLLNLWTIAYFFESLGHEVIYRPTPEGPDVLAVGRDEVFALDRATPLDEQLKLKTDQGY
jgi:hypothetical protein